MPERNPMSAVNDTVTITLPGNSAGAVAAQTEALQADGSAVNAGSTVVLEATVDEKNWITPVRMKNPVGNADADSLVGPNKAGWADVPAFKKVRLRCTAIVGTLPVRLNAV